MLKVPALSRPTLRQRVRLAALLLWPAVALIGLTVVPLLLLLRISVAPRDLTAPWGSGITLSAYGALVDLTFTRGLLHSIELATVVATISLAVGFPLTYFISRMPYRLQVPWLVFLLATLTLSDVLIAFAWQVMFSKRIGLSKFLVLLGLMKHQDSLAPSVGAVVACLVYLVIPFTVLTLYPALCRLDWGLVEVARTLGASPFRAFLSVILPLMKGPAASAFVISAVLTLGSYVPPMVLDRPQHWPMAVLIGNAALAGHDLPRAAAMSILLLCVALLVAGGFALALGRQARRV